MMAPLAELQVDATIATFDRHLQKVGAIGCGFRRHQFQLPG
jgi:hypothetical protein